MNNPSLANFEILGDYRLKHVDFIDNRVTIYYIHDPAIHKMQEGGNVKAVLAALMIGIGFLLILLVIGTILWTNWPANGYTELQLSQYYRFEYITGTVGLVVIVVGVDIGRTLKFDKNFEDQNLS